MPGLTDIPPISVFIPCGNSLIQLRHRATKMKPTCRKVTFSPRCWIKLNTPTPAHTYTPSHPRSLPLKSTVTTCRRRQKLDGKVEVGERELEKMENCRGAVTSDKPFWPDRFAPRLAAVGFFRLFCSCESFRSWCIENVQRQLRKLESEGVAGWSMKVHQGGC